MVTNKFFDLHCHSYLSDGTISPQGLIDEALRVGLSGLSITDHDVIDGFTEAHKYALAHDILLLPGVEISCHYRNEESVHILGYSFDPNNRSIIDFCAIHQKRRIQRAEEIIQKLQQQRYQITREEVFIPDAPTRTIGRPHIAQILLKKGYIKSIQEAFQKLLGSHCPCYVAGERWTIEEAIEAIHRAGGLAVIAHPHLIRKESIVRRLLEYPFDGIEAYYARFSLADCKRWIEIAKKKNWLMTGGSDFHGSVKPDSCLGQGKISEELFMPLYQHYLQHPRVV